MPAYSDGSQFRFTAELQKIWLVSWGGGGWSSHPLPTPPPNGHPELVRWAIRRRRKMTPTPYPPTPKWSSRVGEMSNEEEEEDDPHPLPTHPQMVIQSWWDEQWGGGGRWPPPPTHPPPNGHPELVRWAMRRRRKMTPTPYPPHPQMVLTVKNSRWVIICVFHACLPCTHYTAVPAYWDPEGSASWRGIAVYTYLQW